MLLKYHQKFHKSPKKAIFVVLEGTFQDLVSGRALITLIIFWLNLDIKIPTLAIQLFLPRHFFAAAKCSLSNLPRQSCILPPHFSVYWILRNSHTAHVIQSTRRLLFDQQTKNLKYKQLNQKYNKVLWSYVSSAKYLYMKGL